MAGKDVFTEDEWQTLHRGATGAAMVVSLAERGFSSSFKESKAVASFLAHQSVEGTSQLVRELAGTHGTGWKMTSKPDEVRAETLQLLEAAVALLVAKDPEDVADYRAFVLELVAKVSAADEGGVEVEASAIDEIRAALGA